MPETRNHRYEQAQSMLKIQGIISIVFGAIGSLVGLIALLIIAISLSGAYTTGDAIGFTLLFMATLIFWLLPHVYFIVSGAVLIRSPEPRIAKIITIINVVIGVLWNYILLIFAIISLTQHLDYAEGYHHKKHVVHHTK